MSLGSKIKNLRQNANITQSDLGNVLGVQKSTISMYENDNSSPDFNILKQIASYFNVSTDYLLGNNPPKKDALTQKEKTDIAKEVQAILDDLSDDKPMFELDGKIIDDEIKEILRSSLQNTIEFARLKAKEKYTPKKYKK